MLVFTRLRSRDPEPGGPQDTCREPGLAHPALQAFPDHSPDLFHLPRHPAPASGGWHAGSSFALAGLPPLRRSHPARSKRAGEHFPSDEPSPGQGRPAAGSSGMISPRGCCQGPQTSREHEGHGKDPVASEEEKSHGTYASPPWLSGASGRAATYPRRPPGGGQTPSVPPTTTPPSSSLITCKGSPLVERVKPSTLARAHCQANFVSAIPQPTVPPRRHPPGPGASLATRSYGV